MHSTLTLTMLPFLGAILSCFLQRRLQKGVAVSVVTVMLIGLASGAASPEDPALANLMILFSGITLVAALGQRATREAQPSFTLALLILGLSNAALATPSFVAQMFLICLMGMLALALVARVRTGNEIGNGLAYGAIAGLSVGIVALAVSAIVPASASAVLRLITYGTLLPIFPLQAAFIGSLCHLPDALPALVAVVLPALGWHGLLTLAPAVPPGLFEAVSALALAGALYQTLRGSAQFLMARMTASITSILLAVVWWHVSTTGQGTPEGAWYLSAVTVAASGLLVADYQIQTRYGFLDLSMYQGLARLMPRFAIVVSLLLVAAMGLPLFGIASSFLAMMKASPLAMPASIGIVLLIWLFASLLTMKLLQRLLFGGPRADLLYQDLPLFDLLPLVLVLVLLALGMPGLGPLQLAAVWPVGLEDLLR